MFISRMTYTLVAWLLLPVALLRLLWRAHHQPEYLQHVPERLGFYNLSVSRPVIWLHAVSVGETRAAAPLVNGLLARYPGYQVLLTHTTPTGRQTSHDLFGDRILRCYLPYDVPFAVKRFLHCFRPRLTLLMETEVWVNLVCMCHQAQIPVLLVNARLSQKSALGYLRLGALMRPVFARLAHVAAQTSEDGERLTGLGAHPVEVIGTTKFDVTPPDVWEESGRQLRKLLGESRPIFLAASTREGEEELLLKALAEDRNPENPLLVIVPRHPQRFDAVAKLLNTNGIPYVRRSGNEPVGSHVRVVLGDTMGEMFTYYSACDIAFVGGSLVPSGGQNLIEACSVGKPVLVGLHTFNFAQASELAVQAGAAIRVNNARELMQQFSELYANREKRESMSHAALALCARQRGATQRIMVLIDRYLNEKT
jgi:3-deoxy-D-manno-octulosonic-acid transferase